MALPALPPQGTNSWYAWAQGIHEVVSAVGAAIVLHGTDANLARPVVDLPIVWFGTVSPANAEARDVTVLLNPDSGESAEVYDGGGASAVFTSTLDGGAAA